jgi:hypothetical protein
LLAERMEHNGVGIVVGIIEPGGRPGAREFFDNTADARIVFDVEEGRATGLTLNEGDKPLHAMRVNGR